MRRRKSKRPTIPKLRMFNVPLKSGIDPSTDLVGRWEISTPANVPHFIAVGYYFALSIMESQHVPVGIISSNIGETPAVAWTSMQELLGDASSPLL
jgi:sialate O-acetylesterase